MSSGLIYFIESCGFCYNTLYPPRGIRRTGFLGVRVLESKHLLETVRISFVACGSYILVTM